MEKPGGEEIRAALAKVRKLKKFVEGFLKDVRSDKKEYIDIRSVKGLADRYEEVRSWIVRHFYGIGEQMPLISSNTFYYRDSGTLKLSLRREEVEIILRDMIIGCEAAEHGLEAILKPSVDSDVLDKLNSLRRELEELESEGLDPSIAKNLSEAIAEAEQGHCLASAMIASRVIRYIVDKIPGKKNEDKVKYLVESGVVSRDRKDLQRQIITSMRLPRNFLSHKVDLFPDSGEALMLLGGKPLA